jgi:hypothetical protein
MTRSVQCFVGDRCIHGRVRVRWRIRGPVAVLVGWCQLPSRVRHLNPNETLWSIIVITLKAGSQDDNTPNAHDVGFAGMIVRSEVCSFKFRLDTSLSRLLIVRRKPQAQEASRTRFLQVSAHWKAQTLSS